MKYTGERIVPETDIHNPEKALILLTHLKSYELALSEAKDKIVLDYGCGEGYGANILAQRAKRVFAVDSSAEVINEAKQKYPAENIEFKFVDPDVGISSVFAENSFDMIVSFQVIEHISDPARYLSQIYDLLKPEGKFYLTTPNASQRLLPFQKPWNQFHIKEYTHDSLYEALNKHFLKIKIEGITSSENLLQIERKRTNRNKWILFPFTNMLIPEKLRQFFLSTIKKVTLQNKPKAKDKNKSVVSASKEEVFLTSSRIDKCPNFFAACIK
jgi:2-polyprenyl-3-methyl-5-hydroxy-6-metoxy-1,4-benzoquinol methylase